MATFQLKDGAKTYVLDTTSRVSAGGAAVGRWTTAANKIRITLDGGGSSDVPVEWTFDADNRLAIRQGGADVFVFRTEGGELPGFSLDRNVLVVDPDGHGHLPFKLDCRWGLNADGNVIVVVGGVESTLDGYIADDKGQLNFHFMDRSNPVNPSNLLFSGKWERLKKDGDTWRPIKAGEDESEIRLHFKLDDPALELAAHPLNLPKALKVNERTNHLVLSYQSSSYGEKSLVFAGSVQVNPDWTVTFRIAKSGTNLKASDIKVATTFKWNGDKNTLVLSVGKSGDSNAQTIEVAGAVTVAVANGTLTWSFAYKNGSGGGTAAPMAFATALEFVRDDTRILIRYVQAGKTQTFDVTAKVTLKEATVAGGLAIVNEPGGRKIGAFLGVSW